MLFFFFKQKTAYEMRISDWSSDVCSSDLTIGLNAAFFAAIDPLQRYLREHSALARQLESRDDPLAALPMSTEEKYLAGQVVLRSEERRVGKEWCQYG